MFTLIVSYAATLAFGVAALTSVLAARKLLFLRWPLAYIAGVSIANFAFRSWTTFYRATGREGPIGLWTNIALILQVAIASSFIMSVSLVWLLYKEGYLER